MHEIEKVFWFESETTAFCQPAVSDRMTEPKRPWHFGCSQVLPRQILEKFYQ